MNDYIIDIPSIGQISPKQNRARKCEGSLMITGAERREAETLQQRSQENFSQIDSLKVRTKKAKSYLYI